jgi:hypothetical protein
MKQYLSLVIILISYTCFGQNNSRVCFAIADANSGNPLPRANIVIDGSIKKFTDDNGIVCLMGLSAPYQLSISFIGYQTVVKRIQQTGDDTIRIVLFPNKVELPRVDVLPELPAYLYFGSNETQVVDFEFKQGFLLIGLYNFKQKKCSLIVLDSLKQIVDEQPLPVDFERFYKSCIDRYYAVSTSAVQEIRFNKGIVLLKQINFDFFYDKVIYYKGFYKEYFYIMEPHKSKLIHFYRIENTEKKKISLMAIVGDQVQWNKYKKDVQAKDKHRKADLAKLQSMAVVSDDFQDNEDDMRGYNETETRGEFIRSSIMVNEYKDIQSQLFVQDSAVLIFDFGENRLSRYRYTGYFLDSIQLSFHLKPGWGKVLQKDKDDYYTSYISDSISIVTRLDTQFNRLNTGKRLHYPLVHKWKVYHDDVYYLFSPDGYSNNVFLFKEQLQ